MCPLLSCLCLKGMGGRVLQSTATFEPFVAHYRTCNYFDLRRKGPGGLEWKNATSTGGKVPLQRDVAVGF